MKKPLWLIPVIIAIIMCIVQISRSDDLFVDGAYSYIQAQEPVSMWWAASPFYYILSSILLACIPLIIHDKDKNGWKRRTLIFLYAAFGTLSLALAGLSPRDTHPILMYLPLRVWMLVFGATVPVARALSALFLCLAIIACWRYCEKYHGKGVAFFSTIILALSATWTHYGTEIRAYTMLVFFAIISLHQLRDMLENPAPHKRVLYAIILIIIANIHYLSAFALILSHLIIHWSKKGIKETIHQYAIVFYGCIPVLAYFLMQKARVVMMYLAKPTYLSWISALSFSINYPDTLSGRTNSPLLLLYALILLFIIITVAAFKSEEWTIIEALLVLGPPTFLILLGVLFSVWHPRYHLWALWLVPVLLAQAIVFVHKRVDSIPKVLGLFALVGVIFAGVIIPLNYYQPSHEIQDAAKELIRQNATIVLHETPFSMLPMQIYAPNMRHEWLTNFTKLQRNSMAGDTMKENEIITEWTKLPNSFYYIEHWSYLDTDNMSLIHDYGVIRLWKKTN